ncbi:hypothetical protein ACSS6W_002039 [Trichoderma asperelloides]
MGYLDLQPTPLPQFIHGAWSFDFSGVEVQRCPGLSGKIGIVKGSSGHLFVIASHTRLITGQPVA